MVVIRDPGRNPWTYARIRECVKANVGFLNGMGLGRNDRIAVVMPDGPEMIVAMLTVMAGFTFIPLNQWYSSAEYESYFSRLGTKALIVLAGTDSPACQAARSRGMQVLEMSPLSDHESGLLSLTDSTIHAAVEPHFAESGDLAMILFTSGSTSRPRMVPFTQERLCLILTLYAKKHSRPYDPGVCNVNVRPLFHIQGIIYVLDSMAVWVSVACMPVFAAGDFAAWLEEFRPVWCSLGPPILQELLEYGRTNPEFRFPSSTTHILCSGSTLSASLTKAFEARYGVPIVNNYGMSESLMITGNSPDQSRDKPGSVGTRASPEIRFIDSSGSFLERGQTGEIVLRGPLVITGYLDDPDSNASSFRDGWFMTGDLGYMDKDGYLYITGRVKEQINRGGEKISPFEVEDALKSHPAVAEAVVFAIPDVSLNETVGAAVILKKGVQASADELKKHVSGCLAYFKVPARLWLIDKIPKGPTGKVQRVGFFERLENLEKIELSVVKDYEPPADETEEKIAKLWSMVLGVDKIGRNVSFFDLGGNSLQAASLISLIEKTFKVRLTTGSIFTAPTVMQMTGLISDSEKNREQPYLAGLQSGGSKPPLYCFATLSCDPLEYMQVARGLGADQPVFVLVQPGLDGKKTTPDSVEAMAEFYVDEIRRYQPQGPYHLLAYCAGGPFAYEVACQLEQSGEKTDFLCIIDIQAPGPGNPDRYWKYYRFLMDNYEGTVIHIKNFLRADRRERLKKLSRLPAFMKRKIWPEPVPVVHNPCPYPDWVDNLTGPTRSVARICYDAMKKYEPKKYSGNVTIVFSSGNVKWYKRSGRYEYAFGWKRLVTGDVSMHVINAEHETIMNKDSDKLVAVIRESLEDAQGPVRV